MFQIYTKRNNCASLVHYCLIQANFRITAILCQERSQVKHIVYWVARLSHEIATYLVKTSTHHRLSKRSENLSLSTMQTCSPRGDLRNLLHNTNSTIKNSSRLLKGQLSQALAIHDCQEGDDKRI